MPDDLSHLNNLNLLKLRNFAQPPHCIQNSCLALNVLLNEETTWAQFQKNDISGLLKKLNEFDVETVTKKQLKALKPFIDDPSFNPEVLYKENHAAEMICKWILSINEAHQIKKEVIYLFWEIK